MKTTETVDGTYPGEGPGEETRISTLVDTHVSSLSHPLDLSVGTPGSIPDEYLSRKEQGSAFCHYYFSSTRCT